MTPPIDPLATLIAATQAFGVGVTSLMVTVVAPGQLIVRVTARAVSDVHALAAALDCGALSLVTSSTGRTEWWSAQRGAHGDPLMIQVAGGERDACRCGARKAG